MYIRSISILLAFLLILPVNVYADKLNALKTVFKVFDVSLSMKGEKIDSAKKAGERYIDELDEMKSFRIIVVKFGTFADIMEERIVQSGHDKEILKAAIRGIRADQKDTNFDEMFTRIELRCRQLGLDSASIVVYSDGLSEPTPGSGKPIVNLAELALQQFPAGKFNLYMLNINPQASPIPNDVFGEKNDVPSPIINVRGKDLELIAFKIGKEIERKLEENISKGPKEDTTVEVFPREEKTELYDQIKGYLPYIAGGGILILLMGSGVILTKRIRQKKAQIKRLRETKKAILEQKIERLRKEIRLKLVGTNLQKSWVYKPMTSLSFGTFPEADFLVKDPGNGRIDGQLKVDAEGIVHLTNRNSTFPFTINGGIKVTNGRDIQLPEQATIQISKQLQLAYQLMVLPKNLSNNSVNEIVRHYSRPTPKEGGI